VTITSMVMLKSARPRRNEEIYSVLQCVAVCSSVLQCAAVCCSVFECVVVCCSVLQRVAVCCSVLQCLAVFDSVLQYCFYCTRYFTSVGQMAYLILYMGVVPSCILFYEG